MNKIVTSKEAILCAGKDIVAKRGLAGLTIRDVAQACGVSVGSIYNYFPTKSDLVIATIESVFREILQELSFSSCDDFSQSVGILFCDIHKSSEKFPGFFSSHSINALAQDKSKGRERMSNCFAQIKQAFLSILSADPKVREDAFSFTFSQEDFWDFVFDNLLFLLVNQADSCALLQEVIRRSIY